MSEPILKVPPGINTISSGHLLSMGDACTRVETEQIKDIIRKQKMSDFKQKIFMKGAKI
ncbi:hypothetical protein CWATWH0402_4769 [Crocosphaera watsonii WH 0402]|uniref:Uncharacterized protein n=3 Tax=Crocosphaera watsonii TaxID=263511 RepID=T2JTX0_CROWT|nr:hypothetical protein CWATWH0003_4175 [Crocosphaera watsonii WH 0003]CCQ54099.1 hypothetical protein CWATWH0005_4982 [Crocosphaera watsonii WH 0005]CCQ68067.1 hypothetical protein CWATWH0402_4769 [Crocosphaera watsonii WH 0402]